MKFFTFLTFCGLVLVNSCDNYIENKRAGLRPYPAAEDAKEAEEESPTQKE